MRFNQSSPPTKNILLDSKLPSLSSATPVPITATTSTAHNHQSVNPPLFHPLQLLYQPLLNSLVNLIYCNHYTMTTTLIFPSVHLPITNHPWQPLDTMCEPSSSCITTINSPVNHLSILVTSIHLSQYYNAIHIRHHDLYPGLASTPHCSRQKLARRDLPQSGRESKTDEK